MHAWAEDARWSRQQVPGALFVDQSRVLEVDVNPLFAAGDGVVAVDAVVIVGEPT
jgi:hypothetical protein